MGRPWCLQGPALVGAFALIVGLWAVERLAAERTLAGRRQPGKELCDGAVELFGPVEVGGVAGAGDDGLLCAPGILPAM